MSSEPMKRILLNLIDPPCKFAAINLFPSQNLLGELELQANNGIPVIRLYGIEGFHFAKSVKAAVKLLHDVAEIHFGRLLPITGVRDGRPDPVGELSHGKLSDRLNLANADHHGKQKRRAPVSAFALAVVGVVSAEPVVTRILTLDREGPAIHHF